jgi:acetyl esterase/lipase
MKTLFLALALAAPVFAQNARDDFHLPDGVELQADVVYASPGGRALHLDLYLPKSGSGPFPAVVYIHGGGWVNGKKNAFQKQAAYMATKGYVGACIEYRLSGEAIYPAALDDSKAAVRWLRANAAKYRIDADRIGAAGGSAGGHLVAMLGTTGDMPAFEGKSGNPGFSSRVRAVAAFNPAVDLVSFGKLAPGNSESSVYKFLGCTYAANPKLWAMATPVTHVSKKSAPTLFLHGTADTLVPYQQSVDMMEKLKAAGVHAEIFTGEGGKHGFFNKPPFYEPATKRMEEFFAKHLR